jgi:RNA polymerase sigma-70 factor (ECF subfamily)
LQIDVTNIIEGCKRGESQAQKQLYTQYKSILFGICRRYINSYEDAEDVLVESFLKIFAKIDDFKNEGSFEGWMKRITVNEALMYLRKHKRIIQELNDNHINIAEEPSIEINIEEEKILALIDELPHGYRTILNLYLVEGYKHREIAEMLDISINTSKSQLIHAKRRMQELLKKNLGIDKNLNIA